MMFVRAAQAASRLALVIGNAAYTGAPLPTSANDAGLVAETLAQAGFDVTAMANTTGEALGNAAKAFAAKAKDAGPDATIVVYLAGRGVQVDGDNFFVPIDAKITRGADVATQAMRISDLAKAIDATAPKSRIFIYDLARSNSFPAEDGMPLAGGLALVAAPKGTLYAFNAAPGTVAPNDIPPYGAYARALCEMIQTSGLSLAVLFDRVRVRLGELTGGALIPWDDAAGDMSLVSAHSYAPPPFSGDIAKIENLGASEAYSVVVARDTLAGYQDFLRLFPRDPLSERVALIAAVRREALFWAAASQANESRAFWTYMRHYPRGAHFYDARRRLAALAASLDPPPRFDIESFPDLPPPSRNEAAAIDRPDLVFDETDWDPIPAPPVSLLPPANPSFYEDLPPPPLTDPLALPIPTPVPTEAPGPVPNFGRVMQPAIAARGELRNDTTTSSGGSTSITTDKGGTVVSRIVATDEKDGRRAIVQTGSDQVVLSRTTILHDSAGSTVVQTGPGGGVITKSVTLREADGSWSTLVRNGANQIITDVRHNKAGITVSARDLTGPIPIRHPVPKTTLSSTAPLARTMAAPAVRINTPSSSPVPAPAPPVDPARAANPLRSEAGKPDPAPEAPAKPIEAGRTGVSTPLPRIGPIAPPRPRGIPQKANKKPMERPVNRQRKH